MKKILITGADGLLSSDLVPILRQNKDLQIQPLTLENLDISDRNAVFKLIGQEKPNFFLNLAAYTNVEAAEDEGFELAMRVNGETPGYLAEACVEHGVDLIHISTNCVSDNNSPEGFTEDEKITKAMNRYGETKLAGEKKIQAVFASRETPKHFILRTQWLFGASARNFVFKITQFAREKGEIKVVDDEVGCPTSTIHLTKTVDLFLRDNFTSGIYHICSSTPCSRLDFAKEVLKAQGIKAKVTPMKLANFQRKAQTNHYSILRNTKLPEQSTWQEMIMDFFEQYKLSL